MSHVFHRHTRMELPFAAAGDGPYVIDSEGKRYLDASGGAAVSCLGHSHPAVIQAMKDQLDRIPYAHSAFFTNEAAETLAHMLIEDAPGDLERVYFVSGGSEAVEACLKLARQYHDERGEGQRRYFIARLQSYHGNTLGALSVGGNLWRRRQFQPLLTDSHHISPCYAYRLQRSDESEEEYGLRAADELAAKLEEVGPENVIAFVCEPVVGATLGAVPAVPGYLKRIRDICDRHGVLLILDEVMCGMGRTGTQFACEHDGVAPDLMAIAKGLGAGYQPIGAMLASKRIYDTIANGSGFFQHGHTYMGHPTACAAGVAVQRTIREDGLLANVRRQGENLDAALNERFGNHAHVGDIRGRGLFRALELVAERATKEPFDPALTLHATIKREAMQRGLMCYPMGGTVDGVRGNHVLLAPPFIIDESHVEELVEKLGDAVDAAIAGAEEPGARTLLQERNTMKCPKCGEDFEEVDYAAIKVDRCTGCKGMWFDMLEHEHLKAIEGSESIDIGDKAVGKKYNAISRISCPACHARMIPMVDVHQPHIWYEACPSCYGVFFDAGEFRDYKERTVLDFFRDLFTKERP
jgi:adenosylmethionine-8-amino-7-oxononanoate aminotransferase/Zn-finger nucleic acid-binding protein